MKYPLATADFSFPLLEHERVLQLIQLLDFEGVDIGLFEGRSHLWPSREFTNTGESAKRLRNRLDDLGLKCADVFLQMGEDFIPHAINHPESSRRKKAREWFLHTLDYAGALGAGHVTALPGVVFEAQEDATSSWSRACVELAWRVEEAKGRGIVFGTEAHVGSIAPEPLMALDLVNAVPGLTLTLDYTHFTRLGLPDDQVEPLIQHASHFHVRGARTNRLQCSFTDNVINYERVVQVMKETGYRGYLAIEYVWMNWEHCNEVDNLSETIRFRDFLRNVMH